eukprot:Blabericola_migrator_1__10471@NODE_592_length_7441_cov_40_703011_g145_i3_p5_GENE_NODE_592_length_7441_cov_40_703011_g145_i3NODE_592_length_7441_cov_40_703011_g145_i3_p5_ORF_typecomplete_len141_score4_89_NODE_592_length_7441_cov_40_703011_g145_i333033725
MNVWFQFLSQICQSRSNRIHLRVLLCTTLRLYKNFVRKHVFIHQTRRIKLETGHYQMSVGARVYVIKNPSDKHIIRRSSLKSNTVKYQSDAGRHSRFFDPASIGGKASRHCKVLSTVNSHGEYVPQVLWQEVSPQPYFPA